MPIIAAIWRASSSVKSIPGLSFLNLLAFNRLNSVLCDTLAAFLRSLYEYSGMVVYIERSNKQLLQGDKKNITKIHPATF